MRALRLDSLNVDQLRELDDLYRTTRDVRVRTRAQMILLAAEQRLAVSEVAAIVRESDETVRRWVHRYAAEGIDGLSDAPRSGKPAKASPAYRQSRLSRAFGRTGAAAPTRPRSAILDVDRRPSG
jgi:transposase